MYEIELQGYATYDRVDVGPDYNEGMDGLTHLAFGETEGERDICENPLTKGAHLLPLKLRKQNFMLEDKPKITSMGDYWDEQATKEIFDLLHEYQDLFLASVEELKGIQGSLGEMKIALRSNAQPVEHRPYRLNPRVKEKVKREINKMLEVGMTFPVDEA